MLRAIRYLLSLGVLATLLVTQGGTALAADPSWTAKYWNNKSLSGSPVLTRQENDIDYNWGSGSPASGIGADTFSARWTRTVNFDAARYRFTAKIDDGVRVWVDGDLIIDQWTDHSAQTFEADVKLTAGDHLLKVEYYEHNGDALARFSWAKAPSGDPTIHNWEGEYFNNKNLSGSPVLVRDDSAINFDWGTGVPGASVDADRFSVRWTRKMHFDDETYRFTATTDDGMRVWVDDQKIIDAWYPQAPTTYVVDRHLSDGNHTIRVEYFDSGGDAVARFSFEAAPVTIHNWRGEYFNNMDLSGTPARVRDDASVHFDWGVSQPASGVSINGFSVRWTRTLHFNAGTYRFMATADDGMRVFVDGSSLIDMWGHHAAQTVYADITLAAGDHTIIIEYYDQDGSAVAKVDWMQVSSPPATITNWRGEYFNNMDLSGSPALVRDDAAINFDWGVNSPETGLYANQFSVRWTRTLNFSAGTYRFTATSDDGMRVFVDGSILIDMWGYHAAQTSTADITLASGNHEIRVEYYDQAGSAVAKMNWAPASSPPPPASPPPSASPPPASPTPLPQPTSSSAVTVDNGSAGFTQGGTASDWVTQYTGTNGTSLWTYNTGGAIGGYNWARWYPNLQPGTYEVFAFIPAQNATTANARYWVHSSSGYTLRVVNQAANAGQWVSLGTYQFAGTAYDFISLADVNFEASRTTRVAFDAITFEPR